MLSPALSLPLHLSDPFPLCSTLSLSLSLFLSPSLSPKKGGSGCSVHLYPPRGSNHPPRDRRGVVYPLSHDDGLSAPWHHALHSSSPFCHPLSCVSSFAWGCVQQCVEEPHSVPGYRVRLPEERSLEQSQEVRSACQPHMHAIASSAYRRGHCSVSFCRRTVEDRLPQERMPLAYALLCLVPVGCLYHCARAFGSGIIDPVLGSCVSRAFASCAVAWCHSHQC